MMQAGCKGGAAIDAINWNYLPSRNNRHQRNDAATAAIAGKAAARTNGIAITTNFHRFQRAPNALQGALRLSAGTSAMGGGWSREGGT